MKPKSKFSSRLKVKNFSPHFWKMKFYPKWSLFSYIVGHKDDCCKDPGMIFQKLEGEVEKERG